MGLPLASRIAECSGGLLELDSREGEGTRATLRLPTAAESRRAA